MPDDGRPNPPEVTTLSFCANSPGGQLASGGEAAPRFRALPSAFAEKQVIGVYSPGSLNSGTAFSFFKFGAAKEFLYDTKLFDFLPYEIAEVPSTGVTGSGYDLWVDLELQLAVVELCGFSNAHPLRAAHTSVAYSREEILAASIGGDTIAVSSSLWGTIGGFSDCVNADGLLADNAPVTLWDAPDAETRSVIVPAYMDFAKLLDISVPLFSHKGAVLDSLPIHRSAISSAPVGFVHNTFHPLSEALLPAADTIGWGAIADCLTYLQSAHELPPATREGTTVITAAFAEFHGATAQNSFTDTLAVELSLAAVAHTGASPAITASVWADYLLFSSELSPAMPIAGNGILAEMVAIHASSVPVEVPNSAYATGILFSSVLSPAYPEKIYFGHIAASVDMQNHITWPDQSHMVKDIQQYVAAYAGYTETYSDALAVGALEISAFADSATPLSVTDADHAQYLPSIALAMFSHNDVFAYSGNIAECYAHARFSAPKALPWQGFAAEHLSALPHGTSVMPVEGWTSVVTAVDDPMSHVMPEAIASAGGTCEILAGTVDGLSEMRHPAIAAPSPVTVTLYHPVAAGPPILPPHLTGDLVTGSRHGMTLFCGDALGTVASMTLAAPEIRHEVATVTVSVARINADDRGTQAILPAQLGFGHAEKYVLDSDYAIGGQILRVFSNPDIKAFLYASRGPVVYKQHRDVIYKLSAGTVRSMSSFPSELFTAASDCLFRSEFSFTAQHVYGVSTTEGPPLLRPQLNCDFGSATAIYGHLLGESVLDCERMPPRSEFEWPAVMFDPVLPVTEHPPLLRPQLNADFGAFTHLDPLLMGEFVPEGCGKPPHGMFQVYQGVCLDSHAAVVSLISAALAHMPHAEDHLWGLFVPTGETYFADTTDTLVHTAVPLASAYTHDMHVVGVEWSLPCVIGHHPRYFSGDIADNAWGSHPYFVHIIPGQSASIAESAVVEQIIPQNTWERSTVVFAALRTTGIEYTSSVSFVSIAAICAADTSAQLLGIPVQCDRKEQEWDALSLAGLSAVEGTILLPHNAGREFLAVDVSSTGIILATEDSTLFAYFSFAALEVPGMEYAREEHDPILIPSPSDMRETIAVTLPAVQLAMDTFEGTYGVFPAQEAGYIEVTQRDVYVPLPYQYASYAAVDSVAATFGGTLESVYFADVLSLDATWLVAASEYWDRDATPIVPSRAQKIRRKREVDRPIAYRRLKAALLGVAVLYKDIYAVSLRPPYHPAVVVDDGGAALGGCAHLSVPLFGSAIDDLRTTVDYTFADAWWYWRDTVTHFDSTALAISGTVTVGGMSSEFLGSGEDTLPFAWGTPMQPLTLAAAYPLSGVVLGMVSGDAALVFDGEIYDANVYTHEGVSPVPAHTGGAYTGEQEMAAITLVFGLELPAVFVALSFAGDAGHPPAFTPHTETVQQQFSADIGAEGAHFSGFIHSVTFSANWPQLSPWGAPTDVGVPHVTGMLSLVPDVAWESVISDVPFTANARALSISGYDFLSVGGSSAYMLGYIHGTSERTHGHTVNAFHGVLDVDGSVALHGILVPAEPSAESRATELAIRGPMFLTVGRAHPYSLETFTPSVTSPGEHEYGQIVRLSLEASLGYAAVVAQLAYAGSGVVAHTVPTTVYTTQENAVLSLVAGYSSEAAVAHVGYVFTYGIGYDAAVYFAASEHEAGTLNLSAKFGLPGSAAAPVWASESDNRLLSIFPGPDRLSISGSSPYGLRFTSYDSAVTSLLPGVLTAELSPDVGGVDMFGAETIAAFCSGSPILVSSPSGWVVLEQNVSLLSLVEAASLSATLSEIVCSADRRPVFTSTCAEVEVISQEAALYACGAGSAGFQGAGADYMPGEYIPDFYPSLPKGDGTRPKPRTTYRFYPAAGLGLGHPYKVSARELILDRLPGQSPGDTSRATPPANPILTAPLDTTRVGGPYLSGTHISNVLYAVDYNYYLFQKFYWTAHPGEGVAAVTGDAAQHVLDEALSFSGSVSDIGVFTAADFYTVRGSSFLTSGAAAPYVVRRDSSEFGNWLRGESAFTVAPEAAVFTLSPSFSFVGAELTVHHAFWFGSANMGILGADTLSVGYSGQQELFSLGRLSWDNSRFDFAAYSEGHPSFAGMPESGSPELLASETVIGHSFGATSGAAAIFGPDSLTLGARFSYVTAFSGTGGGTVPAFDMWGFAAELPAEAHFDLRGTGVTIAAEIAEIVYTATDALPLSDMRVFGTVHETARQSMIPAAELSGRIADPDIGVAHAGSAVLLHGNDFLTVGAEAVYGISFRHIESTIRFDRTAFACDVSEATVLALDTQAVLPAERSSSTWAFSAGSLNILCAQTLTVGSSTPALLRWGALVTALQNKVLDEAHLFGTLDGTPAMHAAAAVQDVAWTSSTGVLLLTATHTLTIGGSDDALLAFAASGHGLSGRILAVPVLALTAEQSMAAGNPEFFASVANFDEGVSAAGASFSLDTHSAIYTEVDVATFSTVVAAEIPAVLQTVSSASVQYVKALPALETANAALAELGFVSLSASMMLDAALQHSSYVATGNTLLSIFPGPDKLSISGSSPYGLRFTSYGSGGTDLARVTEDIPALFSSETALSLPGVVAGLAAPSLDDRHATRLDISGPRAVMVGGISPYLLDLTYLPLDDASRAHVAAIYGYMAKHTHAYGGVHLGAAESVTTATQEVWPWASRGDWASEVCPLAAEFPVESAAVPFFAVEAPAVAMGSFAAPGPVPNPSYYVMIPAQYIYREAIGAFLKLPHSLYKGHYGALYNYSDGIGYAVEQLAVPHLCHHSSAPLTAVEIDPLTQHAAMDNDRHDFYTFYWNHSTLRADWGFSCDIEQKIELTLLFNTILPGTVSGETEAAMYQADLRGTIDGYAELSIPGTGDYRIRLLESSAMSVTPPVGNSQHIGEAVQQTSPILTLMDGGWRFPAETSWAGTSLSTCHSAMFILPELSAFADPTLTAASCAGRHYYADLNLQATTWASGATTRHPVLEVAYTPPHTQGYNYHFSLFTENTHAATALPVLLSTAVGSPLLCGSVWEAGTQIGAPLLFQTEETASYTETPIVMFSAVVSSPLLRGTVWESEKQICVPLLFPTEETASHVEPLPVLFSTAVGSPLVYGSVGEAGVQKGTSLLFPTEATSSYSETQIVMFSAVVGTPYLAGVLWEGTGITPLPDFAQATVTANVVIPEPVVACTAAHSTQYFRAGMHPVTTMMQWTDRKSVFGEMHTVADLPYAFSCSGVFSSIQMPAALSSVVGVESLVPRVPKYDQNWAEFTPGVYAITEAALIQCFCGVHATYPAVAQEFAPVTESIPGRIPQIMPTIVPLVMQLMGEFCGHADFDSRPEGCDLFGVRVNGLTALNATAMCTTSSAVAFAAEHLAALTAYTQSTQFFTASIPETAPAAAGPKLTPTLTHEAHAVGMGFVKLTASQFWHCAMYADELNAVIPAELRDRLMFIPVIPDLDFWFDFEEEDSKFRLALIF